MGHKNLQRTPPLQPENYILPQVVSLESLQSPALVNQGTCINFG